MEHIITVKNLTKKYETYQKGLGLKENIKGFFFRKKVPVWAVNDISFQVETGDIIGILGPNGAGKSTTIKMLTGTLYPTEGEIKVMEYQPTKNRKAYVGQIGAVFGQKSQLIWDIPPIDSFKMNKAIYGISDKDFKERLDTMVELFGVTEFIKRPTRVLSLGERMKCEFIMAMLHQPKIVFLDEPTIGLDVIAKQKIREFIHEMNQRGTTFILTTHDLEDVEQLAKNVIVINHGQKVFDDSIENLRKVLGEKKVVHMVLEKPCHDFKVDGVEVTEQTSPYDVTVCVDLSQLSIAAFLDQISKNYGFTDLSIKELPMETIITHIYEKRA